MTSIEASCKSALEVVDADLVELPLKSLVSIPDFMRIVFSHLDILEKITGL